MPISAAISQLFGTYHSSRQCSGYRCLHEGSEDLAKTSCCTESFAKIVSCRINRQKMGEATNGSVQMNEERRMLNSL